MSSAGRVTLDVSVAALLAAALGSVSWFDRAAPTIVKQNPDVTRTRPEEITRPPIVRLAVIRGTFDDMGDLLKTLGPGYRFEEIAESALRDPSVTTRFDAIFLTCDDRTHPPSGPPLGSALRGYVTNGGILYASDLRFEDLKDAFPEFIDANCVTQGKKQAGLEATVTDSGLRDVLGSVLPLHFDLDGWRPAAFGGRGVTVYLKGTVPTTAGVTIDAPLMVKFACGKGSVLFTSFHNTKQNSADEAKLLKFLVLSTVTAGVESGMVESMEKGGFTPLATSLIAADPGKPSRTQTFYHKTAGKLVFSLGFEPRGARLKLTVRGPGGFSQEREGTSTFTVDVPEAAEGQWTYTATAEQVPYENFPFTLGVGAALPRNPRATASTMPSIPSPRSGTTSGTVKFAVISTAAGAAAQATTRIAVTKPHYDDMGKLLGALGSGYRFDVVDVEDLRNPSSLDRFDVVFLTCGAWPQSWREEKDSEGFIREAFPGAYNKPFVDAVARSLERFVTRGGTLYASDWRYDCVVDAFPARTSMKANKALYAELLATEREWVTALAPAAQVGTVEDALRGATLSAQLQENLEALVATIEVAGLADAKVLDRSFDARAEMRELLTVMPSFTAADIDAIVTSLTNRARKIREAFSVRSAKSVAKTQQRAALLELRLKSLRKKIVPERGGSGAKQTLTARVVDPGLREQLGDTIELNFNLDNWVPSNFVGKDQTVLLRGEYAVTDGGREEAPLLVRFTEGKGTVIFTSFHNEKQNSKQEETLLRYLVFTTVTAKAEEAVATTMLSGGFSPTGRSLQSHSAGQPSVTRTYRATKGGPLRFALTFAGQGAAMRFSLTAPSGDTFEKETTSTLVVEATGATTGEWRYTVTAERVPYENYPYSVNVSEGTGGG
jgi:hypothetical protein